MVDNIKYKSYITDKPIICFGCGRRFDPPAKMVFNNCHDGILVNIYNLCETCYTIVSEMVYEKEICFGELRDQALERENKPVYISRDELLEDLENYSFVAVRGKPNKQAEKRCLERIIEQVKSEQAADVVDVVRCRDCSIPTEQQDGIFRGLFKCIDAVLDLNCLNKPYDYCSLGKRKDGKKNGEYIEKTKLMSDLKGLPGQKYIEDIGIYEYIKRIPAADVVDVVRCKDCTIPRKWDNGLYLCQDGMSYSNRFYKPDDYCSYGKRKDGNDRVECD